MSLTSPVLATTARLGQSVAIPILACLLAPQETVVASPPASKHGHIFFWRDGRLASVRPDGGNFQWLFAEQLRDYNNNLFARVSPDGRSVAYRTLGLPAPEDSENIHIKSVAGAGKSVNFGIGDGDCTSCCWGPDSKSLAVTCMLADNQTEHWLIFTETGKKTPLTLPSGHFVTDWSSDGLRFLTWSIAKKEKRRFLHLLDKKGKELRRISGPRFSGFWFRFSPDGRKALFLAHLPDSKTDETRTSAFAVDLEHGDPVQVSPELNAYITGASWSPDGKRIAYTWRRSMSDAARGQECEWFLSTARLDGTDPQTLVTTKTKHPRLEETLWAPEWRTESKRP